MNEPIIQENKNVFFALCDDALYKQLHMISMNEHITCHNMPVYSLYMVIIAHTESSVGVLGYTW